MDSMHLKGCELYIASLAVVDGLISKEAYQKIASAYIEMFRANFNPTQDKE